MTPEPQPLSPEKWERLKQESDLVSRLGTPLLAMLDTTVQALETARRELAKARATVERSWPIPVAELMAQLDAERQRAEKAERERDEAIEGELRRAEERDKARVQLEAALVSKASLQRAVVKMKEEGLDIDDATTDTPQWTGQVVCGDGHKYFPEQLLEERDEAHAGAAALREAVTKFLEAGCAEHAPNDCADNCPQGHAENLAVAALASDTGCGYVSREVVEKVAEALAGLTAEVEAAATNSPQLAQLRDELRAALALLREHP